MRASLVAAIFLVACLDPEAPPVAGAGTVPGGATTAPPPGGGAPAGENGGGNTAPPAFELPTIEPGTGVKLSGTTVYAGAKKGKVRIDVLSMKAGATMPGLVATKTVDGVGLWEVEIPKNAGDVHVVAFLDLANNGPDATDPAGRTKEAVKMAEAAVGGVSVEILDEAELGDLTPGNAPRSDKDAAAAAPAPTTVPGDGKVVDPKSLTGADGKAAPATPPEAGGADAKAAPASSGVGSTPGETKAPAAGSKSTGHAKPASTGK